VVDNDPGNPTHLDDFHAYIKAMFLFPNTILILQPMDKGVTANFESK
jgi:hypothetical protein